MYEKEAEQLQTIIDDSERIVFFGGAGVSTESDIPDFRSADGLYRQKYKYSPEQIVSHTFFKHNTEGFYEFYKEKMMFLDAKPNAAHKKLAELEQAGKLKAIITQNIDGLHQAAGSKNVYEIHGSIHRNYCQKCGKFYDAAYVKNSKGVPHCECGGVIKPDVVLYDVLGDVVCGGFSMPMRKGYADKVFIITSGENMAIHAGANIAMAVENFKTRGYASLGGIILNRRNVAREEEKVKELADDFKTQVIGTLSHSELVAEAEEEGKTVMECFPGSEMAEEYRKLAEVIYELSKESGEGWKC